MENINNKLSLDEKKYNSESLKAITHEELAVILHKHKCWVESEGKEGEQAELMRFNLGGRNLSNVNLEKAKLNGSNFCKTNLRHANLKNAALKGAFLNEADLRDTDLRGAVLRFAELKKANCMWTNFEKADLFRTNFELAEIHAANFVDVKTGDKPLEKILKLAKVSSIYTNNLPTQTNMVQIIDDEDGDEPFNVLETFSYHKEQNLNDEDIEPIGKNQDLHDKERFPENTTSTIDYGSIFKPTNHFNLRLIVVGLILLSFITGIFFNNVWQTKAIAKELNNNELGVANIKKENVADGETAKIDSNDEEIPYVLEIDSDPEKLVENPPAILGVANVTTLDLEEQPKEIIVGDKEVVEIRKSRNNPKKFYLVGKTATSGSNLIIETKSGKTITIFFKVIENASRGDFNGLIKTGKKEQNDE